MNDIKEFHNTFVKTAVANLKKDGYCEPVIFMINDNINIIPISEINREDCDYKSIISEVADTVKPDIVVFISESWGLKVNKENNDINNLPRPSTHDDRIEMLTIYTTSDNFKCFSSFNMIRDSSNKLIDVNKEEIFNDCKLHSWVDDLIVSNRKKKYKNAMMNPN